MHKWVVRARSWLDRLPGQRGVVVSRIQVLWKGENELHQRNVDVVHPCIGLRSWRMHSKRENYSDSNWFHPSLF